MHFAQWVFLICTNSSLTVIGRIFCSIRRFINPLFIYVFVVRGDDDDRRRRVGDVRVDSVTVVTVLIVLVVVHTTYCFIYVVNSDLWSVVFIFVNITQVLAWRKFLISTISKESFLFIWNYEYNSLWCGSLKPGSTVNFPGSTPYQNATYVLHAYQRTR